VVRTAGLLRGLAARLALLVLGLIVALAAVEIAFRIAFSANEIREYVNSPLPMEAARWVDHPFLPFVGRPSTQYTLQVPVNGTQVDVTVMNNAYGFRSHELPATKAPSDYFVVTLGESTTWGSAAATNAETWPELLEAKLRARYPERNVRVFNFGTQNVTLPYSIVALALVGVHLHPDLVITYHGYNEFGAATADNYRIDHSHFFRDLQLDERWLGFQRSIPRALLASYAITYLTDQADRRLGANNLADYVQRPIRFDQSYHDEDVRRVLLRDWQHLRTVDALARGYGGTALFSTFQYFDGTDRFHQIVNETLRATFDQYGLAYVDEEALIPDSDRRLQYDPCHFTDAGNEVMAENFFQAIVARGLVGDRPAGMVRAPVREGGQKLEAVAEREGR
jgi:lysophospholipase L1-like esterase